MIAFACAVLDTESYRRYADPGIRRALEPNSELFAIAVAGGLPRTYNLLLDKAGAIDDLEALVLVHPHAEIADDAFCPRVRAALEDPAVGVVGAAGATGVSSIAWWEGKVRAGDVIQRYTEHGGGELLAYGWTDPAPAPGEADCVDGLLLVLSPWVVRNVRFDESLPAGLGFAYDFCMRVRAAERKVVVADFRLVQHRALELVDKEEVWVEAHIKLGERWEGRGPGQDGRETDWRLRARRAEAEREAARAFAQANLLGADARVLTAESALDAVTATASWRATEPLRRLNLWLAGRRSSGRSE